MRDYYLHNARTGELVTIAQVPLRALYEVLHNIRGLSDSHCSPLTGETVGNVKERINIELLIREKGY